MSSRGRGFSSRGGGGGGGNSYRGRGGGEWSGSSGNSGSRGGFSSSRGGRFNKYSGGGSYDSRSKYNNSSGGSDRYGSRGGRGDHANNYKRARDQSYSSRDDHRSSSESNRKRTRNDSYQGEGSGSSQRYSSTYGGSSSSAYDNKRSSSSAVYDDKRPSERQSSYHRNDERHTSASRSYPVPPPPRISEMAPPSQRYNSNNRGRLSQQQNTNYRGRSSTRGTRGNNFRSRNDLLARKRNLTSTIDYRRKLLTSRSRDYIQRVRMTTKLRRSGASRISGSKKESTTSSMKEKDRELAKAINAEFSDEDDEEKNPEENWDEEEKVQINQEDEESTKEKKPKEEKRKKEKLERANNAEEEEEKEEEKEEETEVKQENEEDEDPEDDREDKVEGEGGDAEGVGRRDGKRFSKLQCPHCSNRSTTFKEYSLHLYSGRHNTAMRRIAARHKANLARMRVLQRQEQRRLEARDAARGTLPSRTMFCQICKLNYRSMKAIHHLSDAHRQMKRFLTPFCRTCRIQFRSPMLYETHVASLDHIKALLRKNSDERKGENGEAEGDSSAPEEDDKEVNLDNFMTLDSVGDVDAEEGDDSPEKKKKDKSDGETTTQEAAEPKKAKTKQMIKVGAEYIKRVEVQFCDLCKVYLPRNENTERAIALHCSTRSHLKRYVRDNDDKALRRQAERIHLQTSSTTNKSTESINTIEATKEPSSPQQSSIKDNNSASSTIEVSNEPPQATEQNQIANETETSAKVDKSANEEEEEDEYRVDCNDKLWEDVDKDIGDILREVEPGKSSDDEDSRYDRFRNSDKKKQAANKEKNEQMETEETSKKTDVKIKIEKTDK